MLPIVHRSLPSPVGDRIVSKNDAGLQWGTDDRALAIASKLVSGGHLLIEGRPIPPVPPPHIKFSDASALQLGGEDNAATCPAAIVGTRTAPSGDSAARGIGVHRRAAVEPPARPAEALRGGNRASATARLTPADVAHLAALARRFPGGFGAFV